MEENSGEIIHKVNFASPRNFCASFKLDIKETFFPDDPFRLLKNASPLQKVAMGLKYFLPILEWLPKYNFQSFRYDLLAGITIASLAIPQGISYAKLGNLPPIIGLYSSFIPPLIYPIFGSSKDLAVGTVAASTLLLAAIIGDVVSVTDDPTLYVNLFFTAAFFTGVFDLALGFFRLGILVDFLSRSTILGFMGGTATIICLQQLKGMLGLKHFTHKTDVVSVLHAVFTETHEWKLESAVLGLIFLTILLAARYLRKKAPKLFWVSAMTPLVVVLIGCLYAFLRHSDKHDGVPLVGPLKKGLNPISIANLNFQSKYLMTTIKAGVITGVLALAEGIAIGRSFAMLKNYQVDGNKEMMAFGMMNIIGSCTSCYLTTGPFSKTAVNYSAGCKTAMSNVVMAICMMLTLLFFAPVFSYTPLVALSAIIMVAMFGLIEYEEAYRLFKVDKFDFCICMVAFLGVAFISMSVGLLMSVGLSILRTLLYVARPRISKLGNIPNTTVYRDVEQYSNARGIPGILILQLGSPLYFASSTYIKERILRWVDDEEANITNINGEHLGQVILDLSGMTAIDKTGIEVLVELERNLEKRGIEVALTNPQIDVMEKLVLSDFFKVKGKDQVFLSVGDAVSTFEGIKASKFHAN